MKWGPQTLAHDFAVQPGRIGAAAVVAAVRGVENGGPDMAHQVSRFIGPPGIYSSLPATSQIPIFFPLLPTLLQPQARLPAVVGGVFIFILVLPGINAIGSTSETFHRVRLARPTAPFAGRYRHQTVSLRIHAHPVKNRSRINIVAAFPSMRDGGRPRLAMDPNGGDIKTRSSRAPSRNECPPRRWRRKLKSRLDLRIIRGVGDDGIAWRVAGTKTAELPIKLAAIGCRPRGYSMSATLPVLLKVYLIWSMTALDLLM